MTRVEFKPLFAAVCLVFAAGPGMAQSNCPCTPGSQLTADQVATLLAGNMACAQVGNESWQEWHGGSGTAGGPVWDYKRGPQDPVDPSKQVGSYTINANNTVSYTYGGTSYSYAVCRQRQSLHAFCGADFGGRDILDVKVGGDGTLQACANVTARPGPGAGGKGGSPR